jgi:predicted flap endonuclease-1-like 5' DNA nuclease
MILSGGFFNNCDGSFAWLPLLFLLGAALLGYLLRHFLGGGAKVDTSANMAASAPSAHANANLSADYEAKLKGFNLEIADLKSKLTTRDLELKAALDKGASMSVAAPTIDTSALDAANLKISDLNADLDACKAKTGSLEAEIVSLKATPMAAAAPVVAAAVSGKKDDLKKVEGIGPVLEKHFHDNGILTFRQMADSTPQALKTILDLEGDRFKIHDPSTWPAQCELCDAGKWDELKTLQDRLKGGRD